MSFLYEITFGTQINTTLCTHKYYPHRKLVTWYNTFQRRILWFIVIAHAKLAGVRSLMSVVLILWVAWERICRKKTPILIRFSHSSCLWIAWTDCERSSYLFGVSCSSSNIMLRKTKPTDWSQIVCWYYKYIYKYHVFSCTYNNFLCHLCDPSLQKILLNFLHLNLLQHKMLHFSKTTFHSCF